MKKKLVITLTMIMTITMITFLPGCGKKDESSRLGHPNIAVENGELVAVEDPEEGDGAATEENADADKKEDGSSAKTENSKTSDSSKKSSSSTENKSSSSTTTNKTSSSSSKSTSSTSKTSSSGSSASSSSSSSAKPASHTHNWVAHYATKTTYTEEPVYSTVEHTVCVDCGMVMSEWCDGVATDYVDINTHLKNHVLNGQAGQYKSNYVRRQTGTQQVAHTEQYIDYYYCSGCGAHK